MIIITLLKNVQNLYIISHTYKINHWLYGLEILSSDYPFIKSGLFEGISNQNKIDGMVIIRAVVTRSNFADFHFDY